MTGEAWAQYRAATAQLPAANDSWPLRGAGLEFLGVNGAPVTEPLPACGTEEILVRVDAVSLCSSDAKMIRLGARYPLFYGRDLQQEPTRLGHEVALTVVQVGERWQGQYARGQRLGLQPDVFNGGQRTCFGVLIPGGLTEYVVLGLDVLAGDAGGYVFPVPDALGYADVALLEPWACVDAAYAPRRRLEMRPGGVLLLVGREGDDTPYAMTQPLVARQVLLANVPPELTASIQRQCAGLRVEVIALAGDWQADVAARGLRGAIDDVILLDPRAGEVVEAAAQMLATEGTLALVGTGGLDRPPALDVGRIHYEFIAFLGCEGPLIDAAYGPRRNRSELRARGAAWVAGAGGPMGRMHVQRALQLEEGPQVVVATNRGAQRLAELQRTFGPLAEAQGKRFYALNPQAAPQQWAALCDDLTGGRGFDDIVVVAADLPLMAQAVERLAPDGMLALFAGLPLGSLLPVPLDHVVRYGAQFTGTSGSSLADQQRVIRRTLAGQLAPAHTVAAIGGLQAAAEGLQAVSERRFAGKIVLFPHLRDLPLLGLDELPDVLPAVASCLGAGGVWTAAAEQALFEVWLGRTSLGQRAGEAAHG
jgi:threonine dehydrogenase-like Zn-dependent dehydrogenase